VFQRSLGTQKLFLTQNGIRLASGSYDNSIRLWETSSGRCLSTLIGPADISSMAVLRDGSRVAWRVPLMTNQSVFGRFL